MDYAGAFWDSVRPIRGSAVRSASGRDWALHCVGRVERHGPLLSVQSWLRRTFSSVASRAFAVTVWQDAANRRVAFVAGWSSCCSRRWGRGLRCATLWARSRRACIPAEHLSQAHSITAAVQNFLQTSGSAAAGGTVGRSGREQQRTGSSPKRASPRQRAEPTLAGSGVGSGSVRRPQSARHGECVPATVAVPLGPGASIRELRLHTGEVTSEL